MAFDPTKFGATKVDATGGATGFNPGNFGAVPVKTVAPPPTTANNPSSGLAYSLMQGAYGLAKGITQAVDKPFLSLLAVAPQVYNSVMGDSTAVQQGQSSGYDFGDFFGRAKPLGAGVDVAKPITNTTNLQALANYAGLSIEGATDFINPVAKGAEAKVAEAVGPGLLNKGIGYAKKAGDLLVGSGRSQFATGQGISAGLEDKGQGDSTVNAVGTGIGSGLMSAATMKLFDVTGNFLKTSHFFDSAMKTKAGQAFTKTLDSIGTTVKSMVDSSTMKDVAGGFQDAYHAVQQDVNNATLGLLAGIRKNINLPDQKEWIPKIINQIGAKMQATRNDIQAGFDKVFGSNTIIKNADNLKGVYQEALDTINKLGSGTFARMAAHNPEAGAQAQSGLAPNLYMYMQRLKSDVLDPVAAGKGFNMSKLNDFINFIDAKGTGGEEAIMGKLRSALHKDVETGLGSMGKTGESLMKGWGAAKESYRQYANTKESAFTTLWSKINNPQTIGNEFLKGGILSDKSQMKELEGLIGPEGIGALRAQIMHTALGNAIDHFKDITVGSLPEEFDAARKEASSEIQKYLDVAESKVGLKPSGSGFQAFSAQQTKWMKDAQHFIQGFNMENIAKGFGLPSAEETAAKSDSLARGKSVYDAAKTPSSFASAISKMTNIEDIKAAMSFVKTPQDKARVGANILKNAFSNITNALRPNMKPEDYAKALDTVANIGGNNKQEAFDEIFGKSDATNALVKGMDDAVSAFKAFEEEKSPSTLRAAANAASALFFSSMGHPIIAMGAAKRSIDEFTTKKAEDVFEKYAGKSKEDIIADLEKDGEIDVSKLTKFLRVVGRILNSRFSQAPIGSLTAKGSAGILGGDDNQ